MKLKLVKKITPLTLGLAVLIAIVAYLIIIGIALYFFNAENNYIVTKTAKIFPYPAIINSKIDFVSFGLLEKRKEAVKKFYEGQDFSDLGMRVDFSGKDGEKRFKIKEKEILDKLIEERIARNLAKKRDIKVTTKIADEALTRKVQEYSSLEDLIKNIQSLYGWGIKDFKKNIVLPDLLKENLEKFVKDNESDFTAAKEKINTAKEELSSGASFELIVKKYSEGESSKNKGELGWFAKDQILPEISVLVFSMNKGETSQVLESSLGYHIINLEDKKTEDKVDLVKIRQIFVRHKNFADWLIEQKKNYNFSIPLRDFEWNKEEGRVEFSNQELRDFESKALSNPAGDASLIF